MQKDKTFVSGQRRYHRPARAALALTALLLSGCAVGPDFSRPKAPQEAGYTAETPAAPVATPGLPGGAAQDFAAGQDIPGQWWTLFRSPSLNALIEEALKANPDVAAAQAALRQARETAYADQGGFFPTVTANASGTREKTSPASPFSVATASLNVSYSPDVFGGVDRTVEASEAQGDYQRFQVEATYLTLTANVVNTAVTIASLRDQIAATEAIIKIESDQLALMKERENLGAIARADILTQEASLDQTRATLPPLQKQLDQARNQLMAYVGRFPNQSKGESFDLASLHLPESLPLSLPSQLVAQRPDVRSAEAQLHTASANIGVAIANQLPQFTITGQIGSSASSLANLFNPGTAIWTIAGAAAQTIFDGGAAEHRKRAAEAGYDQASAQYRKSVIGAFQDVANALRALQADADALKAQAAAEQSAQTSLDLAREQYRLGAIDNLLLLNAEQTYENALLGRVRAQAARYSDTVALFQALGGGWWNRNDVMAEAGSVQRFALPPVQEIRLRSQGQKE